MQESPISNQSAETGVVESSNTTRASSRSPLRYGPLRYAVVDVEIGLTDHRIHDIGALRYDGAIFHKASKEELLPFLERVEYLCGHNIIHHDAKYLFEDRQIPWRLVDTLYLSPLLFPERPYHRLVKDDKLVSDQMNNPVNDCEKARDLLLDEMARWDAWPEQKQRLFTALLRGQPEFDGFLDLMGAGPKDCNLSEQIATVYRGRICQNVELEPLIEHYPCELAYALALIDTTDHRSITPGWVLHNYPSVEFVIKKLRHTPCLAGCAYCNAQLDVHRSLKSLFGYDAFRTYEGEPLQERAAQAAPEFDGLPEGHPISILRRENEALEHQLTALFRLLGKKEDGTAFAAAFPRLNALRAHYAKKEELLMPILYRYGVTGPSEVMWGVDDEIKKELGALTKALKEDAENVVIYRGRLHDLMTRIREMMVKEERILFPLAVRYFTQEEWYAVYRDDKEFAAVPPADTQPKWEEAETWCAEQQEALAREEILDGKVQLETGELTVRQLRALLALFPVDITFIDEDDVLRYFLNEGKIFARPRSALGRKVYECHPPQILPVVRQMLADFKAKKRDHMVVWRRIMGKPVGVRYQAVYGEDGTYLGTVEFVQDFTEALAHFS